MIGWIEERCAERPAEIEIISMRKLVQRKNIQFVHHDTQDNQPAFDEYVCQSRILSAAEYAQQCGEANEATQAYIDMMLEDM